MSGSVVDGRRKVLPSINAVLVGQTVEMSHIAGATLGDGTTTNRAIQILLAIHADPGATPSTIAERFVVARSAVARAVRDLEDHGLVSRTSDAASAGSA